MTEHEIAIMEGDMIHAEDEYFKARPQLDNDHNRKIFEAGFERAWKMREKELRIEETNKVASYDPSSPNGHD